MEVRYNQETEGTGLKNGLKKGKDDKDSQGSLSKSFLKEQQDSFSPSGTVDNCEKNRGSTRDPEYCRRILVRGKSVVLLRCSVFLTFNVSKHRRRPSEETVEVLRLRTRFRSSAAPRTEK